MRFVFLEVDDLYLAGCVSWLGGLWLLRLQWGAIDLCARLSARLGCSRVDAAEYVFLVSEIVLRFVI